MYLQWVILECRLEPLFAVIMKEDCYDGQGNHKWCRTARLSNVAQYFVLDASPRISVYKGDRTLGKEQTNQSQVLKKKRSNYAPMNVWPKRPCTLIDRIIDIDHLHPHHPKVFFHINIWVTLFSSERQSS